MPGLNDLLEIICEVTEEFLVFLLIQYSIGERAVVQMDNWRSLLVQRTDGGRTCSGELLGRSGVDRQYHRWGRDVGQGFCLRRCEEL